MKVFFDTSVLVSALVDQLPRHDPSLEMFSRFSGKAHVASCSTHALAETYATLTALPLARRIQPDEARRLIEANFHSRLNIVELGADDYADAIRRSAGLGLVSGIVYDTLHLGCAEKIGCQRIYTYNTAHFKRLKPTGVAVTSP